MRFIVKAYESASAYSASALREQVVQAATAQAASDAVAAHGHTVLSVRSADVSWMPTFTPRFRESSVLLFCQELLALLDAGMGLMESMDILHEKARDPVLQEVLAAVMERLRTGHPLSEALARTTLYTRAPTSIHHTASHAANPVDTGADGTDAVLALSTQSTFPTLLIASIRAAERTGQLPQALRRYLNYRTELTAVRDKVVAASIYPALLLAVGGLVILFLMVYVVPRFSQIYDDVGRDHLPVLSRWLMQWGLLMNQHLLPIGAFGLLLLVAMGYVVSRLTVRAWLVQRLWTMPRIGEYLKTYQLAQFVRTLSMLLSGGIPLVRALDMTADLLLQPALASGLTAARQAISQGQAVSDAFRIHGLATPVGARLLVSGERSGELAQVMDRIAGFYDAEVSRAVAWFSRLFEPILMVVIGLAIGVIIILMYMPIFELAGSIQ